MDKNKIIFLFVFLTVLIVFLSSVSFAGNFKIGSVSGSNYFFINGTNGNLAISTGFPNAHYDFYMEMSQFIGIKLGSSYNYLNSNCLGRFASGRGGIVFGGGVAADCTTGGNKAYKILITDDGFTNDYGISFDVEVNDVSYDSNLFINGRSGKVGFVGIGTGDPVVNLDIDSNSNSQSLRIRGPTAGTEIADIFVGADGMLVLTTMNTGAINSYIEVDPEDNDYGFIIRDSSTGSTQWANLYMADATVDYLNIVVDGALATPGLVVTDNDYVGIGTITPSHKLNVVGNTNISSVLYVGSNLYLGHSSTSDNDYLYFDYYGSSNYLYWVNAGDLFVFTNDIQVNGQITMATFTAPGSDPMCWDGSGSSLIGDCSSLKEYKSNIREYSIGLSEVIKLRPKIYDWINGSKRKIGFIAEEVQESVPTLAKYQDGNLSGYQEFGLSAAIVNSIKELNNENDYLMNELCAVDSKYSWCNS